MRQNPDQLKVSLQLLDISMYFIDNTMSALIVDHPWQVLSMIYMYMPRFIKFLTYISIGAYN